MKTTFDSAAFLAAHWIGDTFWASQAVALFRERFPDCAVTVYTKPACTHLWDGIVPENQIIEAPFLTSDRHRERVDWPRLLREGGAARKQRFDLMVDLMGNRYSGAFTLLAAPRRAIGFQGGIPGRLAYDLRVPVCANEHLSRRPFRVCASLLGDFAPTPPVPRCRLRHSPAEILRECGLGNASPFVIVAPGAGWPAKEWAPENFQRLCAALAAAGVQTIVTGSPAQHELCERVARPAAGNAHVQTALPLARLLPLLSACAAFVGNDSGLGHLAAAYGRPVIIVFTGETNPALCAPLGPRTTILHAEHPETTPEHVADLVRAAAETVCPAPPSSSATSKV